MSVQLLAIKTGSPDYVSNCCWGRFGVRPSVAVELLWIVMQDGIRE